MESHDKTTLLFVCSSKPFSRFLQRSDYLIKAFQYYNVNVVLVNSFNPFCGVIGAIKHMRIKWKIFSGFRAGVAGLFLSFFGIWWVYDLVEVKSKRCNDSWKGMKRLFIPLVDVIERLMIRRASVVFAAHRSAFQYAKKIRNNVFLVGNGHDEFVFNPYSYDRNSLRIRYGIDFPIAIFNGKLIPMYAKFLKDAIKAFEHVLKEFPNANFWILGEGSAKKGLEKNAGKNVLFKGYVKYEKIPEIITIADVAVHAYDEETLKLVEWLAMGIPVIAPKTLNVDGVIKCEWTPEEIAEKLAWIFKNPFRSPRKVPTWRESAMLILKILDGQTK